MKKKDFFFLTCYGKAVSPNISGFLLCISSPNADPDRGFSKGGVVSDAAVKTQ